MSRARCQHWRNDACSYLSLYPYYRCPNLLPYHDTYNCTYNHTYNHTHSGADPFSHSCPNTSTYASTLPCAHSHAHSNHTSTDHLPFKPIHCCGYRERW
jgi:hypothetical protein